MMVTINPMMLGARVLLGDGPSGLGPAMSRPQGAELWQRRQSHQLRLWKSSPSMPLTRAVTWLAPRPHAPDPLPQDSDCQVE